MKKIFVFAIASAISFGALAQQKFGGEVTKTEIHKAAEIPYLLKDKTEVTDLTIIGVIKEVCQAKGCWMTVDIGGEKMTIKFKDYAFFMPKDASSKQVTFTGKAFKKVISVAEQKHLAEDAKKSKKEINAITKPKEEYRFEASGVELEG
jgi:uncharacterized protein YdeI (BOF family)